MRNILWVGTLVSMLYLSGCGQPRERPVGYQPRKKTVKKRIEKKIQRHRGTKKMREAKPLPKPLSIPTRETIFTPKPNPQVTPKLINIKANTSQQGTINDAELDFTVINSAGKTVYVCCFAYMRRRMFTRWRWSKSDIYELRTGESKIINVATIDDEYDRDNVFGFLGVFDNKQKAEESTYQLLNDSQKLDLDQLVKLKGKSVVVHIEQYGFKKPFFEYDLIKKRGDKKKPTELDFLVENKTGKTLLVTAFIYMKKAKSRWVAALEEKDDMEPWRFDKTDIIKILPNQTALIDVDSINTDRDRKYGLGYLALFEEHERELAEKSTFELLESSRKLNLGTLSLTRRQKVVLEVERYGVKGDLVDFIQKPAEHINFKKLLDIK